MGFVPPAASRRRCIRRRCIRRRCIRRSSSGQSPVRPRAVSRQDHSMVADVPQSPLAWSLVIPVKVLARAKSRLAAHAGASRSALALAMAAVACPAVCAVVVVTDDAEAASALGALGAVVVADEPEGGLNPALTHGA